MREKLGLTEEMLGQLASLKGKTLKSYDVAIEGVREESAYEVVGLTTGSGTIEVSWRAYERILFDGEGEYYDLRCEALEPGSAVRTEFMFDEPRSYLVGERIVSVELIRETGTWKDVTPPDVLECDIGLMLRTSGHTLALLCDTTPSETIDIEFLLGGNAEVIQSMPGKFWTDSTDNGVFSVKREVIKL